MKLTDFVAEFLLSQGIQHVFGLTGGAAVHLFDSVDRLPGIKPIFNHHEQAAALAAEAYAKITQGLGAAFFTTGPGVTNAITGVAAAWLDSVPCIYISGQTRLEHTARGKPIRQIGTQHLEIIPLVKPITKYAVMIDDPQMIKYHLQKAAYLAKADRPGPVWIDIPLNFQWAQINPDNLPEFDSSELVKQFSSGIQIECWVKQSYELLRKAKRPIILAGFGIRLAQAEDVFRALIEKFSIPFLSSWGASDFCAADNIHYVGRPGLAGQRGANFAMQNADLILAIGSHLSVQLTGTRYDTFARDAKRIVVDIDKAELDNPTVRVDLAVSCDAGIFLKKLLKYTVEYASIDISLWKEKCKKYKIYNGLPSECKNQKKFVNPYYFLDLLSNSLNTEDNVVVDGGGTVVYISFQAFKIKLGQRLILSTGICAMGTGLPESIGVYFGSGKKRTICLCGDGSMQLNIQELQTIVHHHAPIKIFVFNNGGYLAIRHTQDGFLNSRYAGANETGGLSLPDFLKVAGAYGIDTFRVQNHDKLMEVLPNVLAANGPVLCEIMISGKQEVIPCLGFKENADGTTSSARPLEDLYPYLTREEFIENMVVEPLSESK